MRSFDEFKKKQAVEERLIPELRELLEVLEQASNIAADMNMLKTLQVIEDARAEIISLEGK